MINLTQEEIDALYVSFINRTVIYKDATDQEIARQDLLNNETHKAIFVNFLNDPDFFARWGTV